MVLVANAARAMAVLIETDTVLSQRLGAVGDVLVTRGVCDERRSPLAVL